LVLAFKQAIFPLQGLNSLSSFYNQHLFNWNKPLSHCYQMDAAVETMDISGTYTPGFMASLSPIYHQEIQDILCNVTLQTSLNSYKQRNT